MRKHFCAALSLSLCIPRFISLYILSHVGAVAEDEGDGEAERRKIYQFGLIFKMQFYAMKIYPHLFYFFSLFSPSLSCVVLVTVCAFDTVYSAYFIRGKIVRHQMRICYRLWITFSRISPDFDEEKRRGNCHTKQCDQVMEKGTFKFLDSFIPSMWFHEKQMEKIKSRQWKTKRVNKKKRNTEWMKECISFVKY